MEVALEVKAEWKPLPRKNIYDCLDTLLCFFGSILILELSKLEVFAAYEFQQVAQV